MLSQAYNQTAYYQVDSQLDQQQQISNRVEKNLVMVKRIAFHMKAKLPDLVQVDDLIQSGMVGLIEAARKFDENQGASFETYAGIRIRGAILDEIRKNDWTPRSVHRNTRKVNEVITRVENNKGCSSTDVEIAKELGLSIQEYHHILVDTSNHRVLSFEDFSVNDESVVDNIPSYQLQILDKLQQNNLRQIIAKAISELPERESLMMSLYYDEELNLREIGAILGVSESRVSQIHTQAVIRLQSRLKDIIEDFSD
jgi:RNA polymerase sigma factor for flagellar operon FliA